MEKYVYIDFIDIEFNEKIKDLIQDVVEECFSTEELQNMNTYLNVILTTPEKIRNTNKKYRNIDKETDVLSFPMFEKNEIDDMIKNNKSFEIEEVLGDIMISIPKVKEQAIEYGHSFERELAYMVVHGFYHIMGYDHIQDDDKIIMREKEENVLNNLNINRE